MESQIKDLYKEFEDDMYCCYIAHWVLYTTFKKAKVEKPKGENIPNEIALHIYFAAKTQSDLNKYGKIINDKITQEIGDNKDGSNEVVVSYHDPKLYYCVISPDMDYNSQDIIQPDFSIRDHIQNSNLYSLARKNYLHYHSNIVKKLMEFGVYNNKEEFQDKYFEDMVKAADQEQNVEECCCAGGMGGGVTTASFAPAVTYTQYPRPGSKKKKKSKKEDTESETIDDVYGFYYCTIYVWIDFHKTGNIKTIYFRVFGKNLDEIDKYNQQINSNIKIIGSDSRILQTTLSDKYYSIAVKDFDFDNQKILDSNLYTNINTPVDFETSYDIIQNDIDNISSKVLSDYTNNLADFTSDLFTKMTEDTDDVYWPVRNDETDAFEQEISNQRQAKKDKIIARKEKTIEKRNQTLANWIARVGDTMDLVKMKSMIDNYNKTTAKHIIELERIKKLPIDSPEFL